MQLGLEAGLLSIITDPGVVYNPRVVYGSQCIPGWHSMDPPRFGDYYRPMLGWLVWCGFSTPWDEKRSIFRRALLLVYDVILVCLVSYMLFLHIYSLSQISSPFPDFFHFGTSGSTYVCSLSMTLYLALCRGRLRKVTDHLDSIVKTIFTSKLGDTAFLEQLYRKNAKFMANLTNKSLLSYVLIVVTFCSTVPFRDWLGGRYRARLPIKIESPYNNKAPVIYELTVLLTSSCLIIGTSKKTVADCLFTSLFNAEFTILKYLYSVKKYLILRDESGDKINLKKLMIWVKLHQEINENIRHHIRTFSPLLVIYSVAVVCIVVSGASVLVMNDNHNLLQPISVGGFVGVMVFQFYLLSNTADKLGAEAQRLAFLAYDLPWYEMKKAEADIVRMVILRSNRPIQVTAYYAPVFLLNRETFNGFLVTAISAFVTLSQIKGHFDLEEP